jgi:translation initiation factor IF-2
VAPGVGAAAGQGDQRHALPRQAGVQHCDGGGEGRGPGSAAWRHRQAGAGAQVALERARVAVGAAQVPPAHLCSRPPAAAPARRPAGSGDPPRQTRAPCRRWSGPAGARRRRKPGLQCRRPASGAPTGGAQPQSRAAWGGAGGVPGTQRWQLSVRMRGRPGRRGAALAA